MTTKEIWRSVPTLVEYMASSHGRIMRAPYTANLPWGGTRKYGGQPHNGVWDGKRYTFWFRGKNYKVARLVCAAFHGLPPEEMPYCLHIDENARNNRPENLKWGTQKENLNAPGFVKYCKNRTGESSPRVKAKRTRDENPTPPQ
jgi:hypothetical protein